MPSAEYQRARYWREPEQARKEGREYMRDWYARGDNRAQANTRRRERYAATKDGHRERRATVRAFVDWLKSVPCADCRRELDPVCMDFDHLRDKSFNLSRATSRVFKSLDALQAEVMKCEVVCANCHRLRTWRGCPN